MSGLSIVHLSDLHFGAHVDLRQIAALERLIPELAPSAVVISGDVSQRARHGEFQRALKFVEDCRRVAPTLIVPGNHDTAWWASPFGLLGKEIIHRKYHQYFPERRPVLRVPGAVIVGVVSAHGLAWGSVTWKPRDLTVKGHLPRVEVERAAAEFASAGPNDARVLVLHHNVMRGRLSNRWGLAHPGRAHQWIAEAGADLVLCGHDHEEAVGRLPNGTVVAASNTHSTMTRGRRPSAFNLIEARGRTVEVTHRMWNGSGFD